MTITHDGEQKFYNDDSMKEVITKRLKFNEKFSLPTNNTPTNLTKDRVVLHKRMMEEELEEYFEAALKEDLLEVADGIGDMLFILLGIAAEHGLLERLEDIYNEIYRSNMSKLGKDGKPVINGSNGIFDDTKPVGKLLKGPDYFPPNLKQFL